MKKKNNTLFYALMLAALVGVLALNRYALLGKLFTILLVIVILGFSLLFFLVDYGKNYLASEKTAKMPLPGDDLLKDNEKVFQFTKEITIDAPPAKVWPYLAQMGQEKAGFYSYELLEKIFTFDIHNTYEIMDKWQDVKPGDWLYYHQMGIGSEIIKVEKGHYFTSLSDSRKQPKKIGTAFALNVLPSGAFAWTWIFIVQELPGSKTLLIQRCHNYFRPANFLAKAFILFFLGIPSLFMTTKQMEVVKACAEGHGPSSSVKNSQ